MKQSVVSKNAEMMDNIDGWLVVVTADEVDELAPVSVETQVSASIIFSASVPVCRSRTLSVLETLKRR